MEKVLERFLNYVKIDTQSDDSSPSSPSSDKQFDLAKLLVAELKQLGFEKVTLDDYCNVQAELKSNTDHDAPAIGFIAHMDTATEISGQNVNPQIIENYNGQDLLINRENNIVLKTSDFPELKNYIGQTLVTTDGTTLLGADDKAGIAEIITALSYFIDHPEVKHGPIKIAFTPDEEVGRGTENFDVLSFGADFAYTVDGGAIGCLEYETFNAAKATIAIRGRNVHPGTAKDKMINAARIAFELNEMLPVSEKPEYTENYEGFFHLTEIVGSVENATIKYIIRDHSMELFEKKKALLQSIVDFLIEKYGPIIHLTMEDQYYNMVEKIKPVYHIVEKAQLAMLDVGITPVIMPVRGGTDGARLSFMGLPTPNLFTGGHNFHGKYEFIPVESMMKSVETIKRIVVLFERENI
ncbi:MAG: peptidase T [Tissierellales bacterium]|nr:peptidase T [Tissierellales bacterium]